MNKNHPKEMEPPIKEKEIVDDFIEFNEIKSTQYVTEDKVQEMIDDAIRKHNRNASIISFWVGWVVLALFADGLLRLVGAIPPLLPWLKITL